MIKYTYNKNNHYCYTLTEDYSIKVSNVNFGYLKAYGVDEWINNLFIECNGDTLIIKKGYSWDGCTGAPTYDWNLEPSLVHDVLYQLKKNKNGDACKVSWYQVDRLFLVMMKEANANWFQRNLYYMGVRTFGFFCKFEHFKSLTIVPLTQQTLLNE